MMRPRRQNPQTTGKRGLKMRSFKKETHRALCKTATFFGRPAAPEPGSTQQDRPPICRPMIHSTKDAATWLNAFHCHLIMRSCSYR